MPELPEVETTARGIAPHVTNRTITRFALHEPRLRAVTGAWATNDVRGGYLYVTLTETTGNIWMMQNDSQQRSAMR